MHFLMMWMLQIAALIMICHAWQIGWNLVSDVQPIRSPNPQGTLLDLGCHTCKATIPLAYKSHSECMALQIHGRRLGSAPSWLLQFAAGPCQKLAVMPVV